MNADEEFELMVLEMSDQQLHSLIDLLAQDLAAVQKKQPLPCPATPCGVDQEDFDTRQ